MKRAWRTTGLDTLVESTHKHYFSLDLHLVELHLESKTIHIMPSSGNV